MARFFRRYSTYTWPEYPGSTPNCVYINVSFGKVWYIRLPVTSLINTSYVCNIIIFTWCFVAFSSTIIFAIGGFTSFLHQETLDIFISFKEKWKITHYRYFSRLLALSWIIGTIVQVIMEMGGLLDTVEVCNSLYGIYSYNPKREDVLANYVAGNCFRGPHLYRSYVCYYYLSLSASYLLQLCFACFGGGDLLLRIAALESVMQFSLPKKRESVGWKSQGTLQTISALLIPHSKYFPTQNAKSYSQPSPVLQKWFFWRSKQ